MTRIDFYILNAQRPAGREHLACRLAEKAYGLGHRVHIHANDPQSASRLDDLLWTYRDGSFIPHALEPQDPTEAPVSVGHDWQPDQACDVLINLATEVPNCFSRFERVAEILDPSPEIRQQGRERYRFYRDRGYELNTHELGTDQGGEPDHG